MKKRIIFDIGANSGENSIPFALGGDEVYAFEPTPELSKILKDKTFNLPNYHIISKAVSDFNGISTFNVAGQADWGCSSLLEFNENLNQTWSGREDFKVTHKIEVEVITLEKFIEENDIKYIDWLHCDAQGQDLNVLIGLGKYLNIVKKGVIETAQNSEVALYKSQHTLKEVIQWLSEKDFEVTSITPNDPNLNGRGNEINIQFYNPNFNNI